MWRHWSPIKKHKSLNNFVKNGSFWLKIGPVLDLRNTQNISGPDFWLLIFSGFFGPFWVILGPKWPKMAQKSPKKSKVKNPGLICSAYSRSITGPIFSQKDPFLTKLFKLLWFFNWAPMTSHGPESRRVFFGPLQNAPNFPNLQGAAVSPKKLFFDAFFFLFEPYRCPLSEN